MTGAKDSNIIALDDLLPLKDRMAKAIEALVLLDRAYIDSNLYGFHGCKRSPQGERLLVALELVQGVSIELDGYIALASSAEREEAAEKEALAGGGVQS
jgi:hypothetical protein